MAGETPAPPTSLAGGAWMKWGGCGIFGRLTPPAAGRCVGRLAGRVAQGPGYRRGTRRHGAYVTQGVGGLLM
jgi:hypothetical protein